MTIEKVQIKDATLYRGDCMEILPTLGKVDAVVDKCDAVVFNDEHEKSAKRQHRTSAESGDIMGSPQGGYNGAICERGKVSSSDGGEIRGVTGGVPEGSSEAGHTIEVEGQGWEGERTLQGWGAEHGLSENGGEKSLQPLWGDEPAGDTSHRRHTHEQHTGESGGVVQSVPQQPPQAGVVEFPKGWAILTDPPYGIGHVMKGGKHWTLLASGNAWDMEAKQEWVDAIIKCDVPAIVWGGQYFNVPPSRCWLIWSKCNAVPTMADAELAWTSMDKPTKQFIAPVGRNNYGHPTEKPLPLIKWCIEQLPKGCNTILDPFMGSGTTGVACAKMGRKFIGIELDPGYFEIACRRIEEAYAQPDMFIAPPKPKNAEPMADLFTAV